MHREGLKGLTCMTCRLAIKAPKYFGINHVFLDIKLTGKNMKTGRSPTQRVLILKNNLLQTCQQIL